MLFSSLLLQSLPEPADFRSWWPQLWMNLIWLLITELISLVHCISGHKALVPQERVIVKKKETVECPVTSCKIICPLTLMVSHSSSFHNSFVRHPERFSLPPSPAGLPLPPWNFCLDKDLQYWKCGESRCFKMYADVQCVCSSQISFYWF